MRFSAASNRPCKGSPVRTLRTKGVDVFSAEIFKLRSKLSPLPQGICALAAEAHIFNNATFTQLKGLRDERSRRR